MGYTQLVPESSGEYRLSKTNVAVLDQGIADAHARILTLASGTSVGATALTIAYSAPKIQQGQYVAVGVGTTGCEIRRVSSVSGANVTLSSALKAAHSSGEDVAVLTSFWVPLEWWGAKADNSTDSYRSLINAFLDQSLGNYYGLVGKGATAYMSSRPLFQQDYTALAYAKIQAHSSFALDCTTTVWNGIPNQYFFTLAGQTGTATFDAATDVVTMSINPGGAQYSDVVFYPRPGSTMPGGIEEGRRYFTITGNSVTTQVSAVQGSSTPIDVTSAGSGEIVVVSVGAARAFWKNVMLHGNYTKALNGLIAFVQQPSTMDSVRIEGFPVVGASIGGQQGEFSNLFIFDCWTGLEMMGAEFCYFPFGNIESCDINCSFPEVARMLGGAGENFGNYFAGFHWESPGGGPGQIQTLNRTGTPTSGTFQLRFKNVLTSAVNWNDTAAQLQTKLEAHAAIGSGNVTCTQLSGTNLSDGPVRVDFTVGTLKWEFWSGSTSTTTGGIMAVVNSTLSGGTMTNSFVSPNARNISYKRGISNRFSASVFTAVGIDPVLYNAPFIKTEGTANDPSTGKNHGYHITDLFTSISTLANLIDDSNYGILLNSKDADANGVASYVAEFIRPSRHGSTIGQHWWFVGDGGRVAKLNTAGKALLELKAAASGMTDNLLEAHSAAGALSWLIDKDGRQRLGGASGPLVLSGSGTPEAAVTAPVGSVYLRTDGGTNTSLYRKESGSGNTGWVAVSNAGGGSGSSRLDQLQNALGYYAASFPLSAGAASQASTSQTLYGSALFLRNGDVVTNVVINVTAAVVTVTTGKVGLYDKNGALLASCANDTGLFNASGPKTKALSSAYNVTADDVYYAAVLCDNSSQPSMVRGLSTSNWANAVSGKPRPAWVQTGQTDLPSTATFSTATFAFWMGVS